MTCYQKIICPNCGSDKSTLVMVCRWSCKLTRYSHM